MRVHVSPTSFAPVDESCASFTFHTMRIEIYVVSRLPNGLNRFETLTFARVDASCRITRPIVRVFAHIVQVLMCSKRFTTQTSCHWSRLCARVHFRCFRAIRRNDSAWFRHSPEQRVVCVGGVFGCFRIPRTYYIVYVVRIQSSGIPTAPRAFKNNIRPCRSPLYIIIIPRKHRANNSRRTF